MCLEGGGGEGRVCVPPGPLDWSHFSVLPYFGTHHVATMHRSDNVVT